MTLRQTERLKFAMIVTVICMIVGFLLAKGLYR